MKIKKGKDKKIKNRKKINEYSVLNDKKMLGTILLIVISALQIFAFLEIPFLSTINGYTIGMLLGFYNPFFYLFFAYYALYMIFGEAVMLPKWLKLSKKQYWFLAISIIFISSSMGYYQSKDGFTLIGTKSWGSFKTWYNLFTNNETASGWFPVNTNGGVIGVFLYSFISMISSGIGALIISIIMVILSISFVITGSSIGLYKDIVSKKKLGIRDKRKKQKKDSDSNQFNLEEDKKNNFESGLQNIPKEDENTKNVDSFPFDDPF
ncbi:MAG: hypothetical protein HRT99_02810 [Mycoplasmatales bacterium]|nr:hypothetical protein [Mycoplasmatales bacterium]